MGTHQGCPRRKEATVKNLGEKECLVVAVKDYWGKCTVYAAKHLSTSIKKHHKSFSLDIVGIHILQELERGPIAHFHP